MHSDYKNQKISDIYSINITLPVGSSWLDGDYVDATLVHGIGRYLAYYAEVYFNGKSFPVINNASPQIKLVSSDLDDVGAAFQMENDTNTMSIQCWATGFGTTSTENTFQLRVRFVLDDIL